MTKAGGASQHSAGPFLTRYAATFVVPWKSGRSGSQMKRIRVNVMSATA
jgi:hypothetical protein